MVLISSTKYACETCIKGHRSSACKHTDRPLFEIKKKGRPVTQCDHCRELRKTKQVHVKCLCEAHEGAEIKTNHTSTGKKAHTKVPESPTFPNGLPAALEVVALSETTSSDTGSNGAGCTCGITGECHCCTPRVAVRKSKSNIPTNNAKAINRPSSNPNSHILARVAQLRPILARPGPIHDPSSQSGSRHHEHLAFSPYNRAYETAHGFEPVYLTESDDNLASTSQYSLSAVYPYPTLCSCGEHCGCRGCVQHTGAGLSASSQGTPCVNSGSCGGCLDCTLLSLPPAPIENTALPNCDNPYPQSVDDWIRQLSHGSSSPMDEELPTSMIGQSYAPAPWNDLQSTPKMIDTVMVASSENGYNNSEELNPEAYSAKAKSLPDVTRLGEPWIPLDSDYADMQSVVNEDAFFLPSPEMGMSRSRSSSFSSSSVGSVFSSAEYNIAVRPASPSVPAGRVQSRGRRTVSTKDSEDLLTFISACCSKGTPPPSSVASVHDEPLSPYREPAYAKSNPELYTSTFDTGSNDRSNFDFEDVVWD